MSAKRSAQARGRTSGLYPPPPSATSRPPVVAAASQLLQLLSGAAELRPDRRAWQIGQLAHGRQPEQAESLASGRIRG